MCVCGRFSACLLLLPVLLAAGCNRKPVPLQDVYLGPPNTYETHAKIIVETGKALGEVYRLRSTARVEGAESTALLPEVATGALEMPTNYVVVAKGRSGTLHVDVDALGKDGWPVGRGSGDVELVFQDRVTLTILLEVPCDTDADCSDGVFCNGAERCLEGVCGPALSRCVATLDCVDSVCNEAAQRCDPVPHSERCAADEYCNVGRGCASGLRCKADAECASAGDHCRPSVCSEGHCVDGQPVNPDDGNPCTLDSCDPATGPVHLDRDEGNRCSLPGAPREICRWTQDGGVLSCLPATCGDGFVDIGVGEECDLGAGNDDDHCTHLCKLPRCGDSIVEPSLREECDDGSSDTAGDCIACRKALCGDGYVHSRSATGTLEECDDGEENGLGACSQTCKLTSFEVIPLMGVGCGEGPDAGVPDWPDAGVDPDGGNGWDYGTGYPFVNGDTVDARCVALQGIQDLTLRNAFFGGNSNSQLDELVVADTTGFWAVNVRTGRAKQMFPPESSTYVPECRNPLTPWTQDNREGLPHTAGGVDGLGAMDQKVYYRSATDGTVFRAAIPAGSGMPVGMESFGFQSGTRYSIADCCTPDFHGVWRTSFCDYCPNVHFDAKPGMFFSVVERWYSVFLDTSRAMVHMADDQGSCDNSGSVVSFSACAGVTGPDGGVLQDADGGVVPLVWRYGSAAHPNCREGAAEAMLMSMTDSHQVVRAGLTLPGDLLTVCMSAYRPIAGIPGQAGNGAENERARGAALNTPTGTGQDAECNIYFADTGNELVRQVTLDGRLHNVVRLPGLRTLVVHGTLGVFAATQTGIYRILLNQE